MYCLNNYSLFGVGEGAAGMAQWQEHSSPTNVAQVRFPALRLSLQVLPPQKSTLLNSNLTRKARTPLNRVLWRYKTAAFETVTLFTLDMIANTAESVISVVSIPRCAKLLARS